MLSMRRIVSRLPSWMVVIVTVACVVLGAILTLRPFTSADVLVVVAGLVAIATGVLSIVSGEDEGRAPSWRWLVGLRWIGLGIVVLAWPGLTVQVLAVIIGVVLIVNGLVDIVQGLTGRTEERAQ